jgi:hypothetical protein
VPASRGAALESEAGHGSFTGPVLTGPKAQFLLMATPTGSALDLVESSRSPKIDSIEKAARATDSHFPRSAT